MRLCFRESRTGYLLHKEKAQRERENGIELEIEMERKRQEPLVIPSSHFFDSNRAAGEDNRRRSCPRGSAKPPGRRGSP